MAHVLVVDDEREIASLLERTFVDEGYRVAATSDPEEGLRLLKQSPFDVVVTDLRMPEIDGLEILRRGKAIRPDCEFVLITAHATVETAREALKRGAVDYLTKPFSIENELKPLIRSVLRERADAPGEPAADRTKWTAPISEAADPFEGIVAKCASTRTLLDRARRVARSDVPVLLRGESGTGKEVVAGLIHRCSERSDRPMVTVNCAALPDSLLESALFGHVKGSFTGATSDSTGFFEAANGGTIFLDEIGEISFHFQPKLLRVLETGEFHRIGDARRVVRADVRLVAATNRNLEEAIEAGVFREDLYYRLNVVPLTLPPLRERREDLPALIEHFIERRNKGRSFSPEALRALERYDWPGNVRELVNAVEHALVLSDGPQMELADLPVAVQDFAGSRATDTRARAGAPETLEEIEVRCILQAIVKTGFNRTQAAGLLGVSRRTLGYRIDKYGLEEEIARRQREILGPPVPRRQELARSRPSKSRSVGS